MVDHMILCCFPVAAVLITGFGCSAVDNCASPGLAADRSGAPPPLSLPIAAWAMAKMLVPPVVLATVIRMIDGDRLDLSPTNLVVLLNVLMHWWYPEQKPFPRSKTIAKRMGLSPRAVQRSLQHLQRLGLLAREKAGDGRTYLNPDPLIAKLEELAKEDIDYEIRSRGRPRMEQRKREGELGPNQLPGDQRGDAAPVGGGAVGREAVPRRRRGFALAEKLTSEEGRALYKLRRQTVEPVFGVIKAVLGFSGFSLRGLDKVEGEWTLVALAYNCKRLHKLSLAT